MTGAVGLRGTIWPGGTAPPFDGTVVVGPDGTIAELGPDVDPPGSVPSLGGPGCWIGPGIVDAHAHLAFGDPAEMLAGAVVAVRDLGAPLDRALAGRTGTGRPPTGSPWVSVAGPIITATGGYPSRTWGSDGFALFADTPSAARAAAGDLLDAGVDLLKVAFEPGQAGQGWPVLPVAAARAVAETARAAGRPVVAHALTLDAVLAALDAGVDELAHTPTEALPGPVVDRIAAAGISVTSTLATFVEQGLGDTALANAAALVRAGVTVRYGTDLGNDGTRPGADPRELDLLVRAGLGRYGALRAATAPAGPGTGPTGRLAVGEPAALVLLESDPTAFPDVWTRPIAVVTPGSVWRRQWAPGRFTSS